EEIAASVIEYAVDDHTNISRVSLLQKIEKQLVGRCPCPTGRIARLGRHQLEIAGGIRTEIRIDMMERRTVVFMKRIYIKNWVQVERVDSQSRQILELRNHPLQVAAVSPVEYAVLKKVRSAFLLPVRPRVPITGPRRDLPAFRYEVWRFE